MSEIDELDAYIKLMNLLLEHPFTTKIPIANGKRKSSEEFVFAITPSRYRKLEQIRGDYNFKLGDRECECNILHLTRNQVRLQIEGLDARHIKSGTINVDTSNILKREKDGLQRLNEDRFLEKNHLLFGNRDLVGGVQSECIFEEDLNEEQRRAVEYAVGVRDVYLIWGPPGTGKTTIVPEIVRNYIRLHKEYLFSTDAEFEDDLNKGIISEKLRRIFKTEGFPISEDATVRKEKEAKWEITDGEKIYIVTKEDEKLNICHKDNPKILVCSYTNRAVDNVVKKLFDNNRCKKIIVRFGDSTLTGKYKAALFDEQLKKKRKEIEKESGWFNEKINQLFLEKKKIEKEHNSKSREAKKVEKDKEAIIGEINALDAEIARIEEQVTEKERSLLNAQFEGRIDQINGHLQEHGDDLKKLPAKKKEINEEIKELEIQVSKLKEVRPDIHEQLNKKNKKETDTTNIIHIIEYYLEFAKGPKQELEALSAEIPRIKKQIAEKERSLLKSHLEVEMARINEELMKCRDNLREFPIKKKEINDEMKELKTHVSNLEDAKSDINGQLNMWDKKEKDTANIIRIVEYYLEFAKGPKQELEALSAEIPRIKKQIAEKERSLLTAQLKGEIDRIDEELRNYRENLNELQQEKEVINRAIEGIANEVLPGLNRDISNIPEQLDRLKKMEHEIANIISIIKCYQDFAKKNKIVAFWKKYVFTRQNSLYEQYKQEIAELQLARRNRSELEKILQEKLKEQKKGREERTKLQNDLNARELEIREKEEELERKKEGLIAVEENHTSLSGTIERLETKLEDLERDRDSLARGELEYDRDTLRRQNQELRVLYDDLSRKKDRIRDVWRNFTRGRQKLLYEQYKQGITELRLARRNCEDMETILQEKLEEQEKEREEIAKLKRDLNERELREKELERKKEELSSIEKNHASLSGNIESGEKKRVELKRDIDSLAHGKLEYDSDALRRENPELHELYNELRNKQGDKNQKEADLEGMEKERIDLSGLIEKLMNSVMEKIAEIEAVKEKMQEEMKRKMEEARLAILKEKQIIATTNLRTYNKVFESINFDLVIMDEAGAIDLPGAVLPFLKGNKFILLGDPEQLPPILVDRLPEIRRFVEQNPGLRLSIFERFYKTNHGDNQAVMLTSQYRMNREIADFISSSFYEGLLNTPAEIEIGERLGECQDDIINNHYSMVCFQRRFWTDYEGGSAFSIVEIEFLKKIIEKFRRQYGKRIYEEIAIISPYKAQIDKIEDEIPDIECGTVHAFQGHEKKIIIFATAKYLRSQSRGFGKLLEGPTHRNLLNVAVSRAKEKFIIIGSEELFENVSMYKRLYGHIREYGHVNKQNCCMMCGEDVPEGRQSKFCSEECYSLFELKVHEGKNPSNYTADDKHSLRSTHEMLIDNWFTKNGIKHEVEKRVPNVNKLMRCDWFLPKGEIYVEYWGLMHEEWYRKARKVKERLYRQANLRLGSIEPEDMKKLDERLRRIFGDVLNQ